MIDEIEKIREKASREILAAKTVKELQDIKVRYLGRKGLLTIILRGLASLPPDVRPRVGSVANRAREEISKLIEESLKEAKKREQEEKARSEKIDVTLPGTIVPPGKIHPLNQITQEIVDILGRVGFDVFETREVELEYYNFEALNFPPDHPSRDMQDTFFITDKVLLRTHTSPGQIRVMEMMQPPIQVILPGKCYRPDLDQTHSPMFHQVEGLMVDESISLSHLKGVLTYFVHEMFGKDTALRFRPSFFPFTEPSAEVDIQCVLCKGEASKMATCRMCKGTGWLEILGAGMVDPELFRVVGYDTERYTGFAFGMGVERIAMLKWGIDDIRLFFENDVRFLEQF